MAFTKVRGPGINTTDNYQVGVITATKLVGPLEASSGSSGTFDSLTVSGNISVGGTLTYEDVTNVDSLGIITARKGISVSGGGTLDQINATGVSTFSSTTNITGELRANGNVKISNVGPKITLVDTNNDDDFEIKNNDGVFTVRDATNSVDRLAIASDGTSTATGTSDGVLQLDTSDSRGAFIRFGQGGSYHHMIGCADGLVSGPDKEDLGLRAADNMVFCTNGASEKARITSAGLMGLGTNNPSRMLHVKSAGANATQIALIDNDSTNEVFQIGQQSDGDCFVSIRDDSGNTKISFDASGTSYFNGGNVLANHNASVGSGKIQAFASQDAVDILSYSTTNTHGGRLTFYRSKNATIGSNTEVASGDSLGRIDWRGYNDDGTTYNQGARIEALVDGAVNSSTDMPSALVFKTSPDGSSTPEERLRIDSSGRVIITNDSVTNSTGTNTQYASLNVRGNISATSSRAAFINFARSEASANIAVDEGIGEIWFGDQQAGEYGAIKCTADGTAAVGDYPGRLTFHTTADGGTTMHERLRIDNTGRLLLGAGAISLPKGSAAGSFDLDNGNITMCIGGNQNSTGRTNSTDKINRITSPHYTNAEEPVALVSSYNTSSQNIISYGGGSGQTNAATEHGFYVGGNTTSTTGALKFKIDTNGDATFYEDLNVHNIVRTNAKQAGGGHMYFRNNSQGANYSSHFQTYLSSDEANTLQTHVHYYHGGYAELLHQGTSSIRTRSGGGVEFRNGNSSIIGEYTASGLAPGSDNALDLGSSSKRWRNIYTGDLQLSNVSGSTDQNGESITPVGNEVDNTQGTWTIQEGLNDLFLINRINGKKYKFNLTEVS